MFTREWLINITRFYQKLKFFEEYINFSDEELANQIISLAQKRSGRQDISSFFRNGHGLPILCLDTKRVVEVWSDYLYGEMPSPYNFEKLVETIQELARISRGAFVPQNIKEIYAKRIEIVLQEQYTEEGISDHYYIEKVHPGTIEFVLNDKSYYLTPKAAPDDPLILISQINPMIIKTGYQFINECSGSPYDLIITMTEEEFIRGGNAFRFRRNSNYL